MNKLIIPALVLLGLLQQYCGQQPGKEKSLIAGQPPEIPIATIPHNETNFNLEVKKSRMTWTGSYITGGGHEGTLAFDSGSLATTPEGMIARGSFVIDMSSIVNTDVKEEDGRRSLANHLKDDDFFSVKKFPKAFFTITKAAATDDPHHYNITGNLTLKGITHPVNFPASINVDKDTIHASASILFDRTKWGITYESQGVLGILKDGAIADMVKVGVEMVFVKTFRKC